MLTISDLNQLSMPTTAETVFRGKTITIRALSAYESQQLAALYPRPTPPPAVRPGAHPINGEIFYNESDAAYRQSLQAWTRRLMALEVAAAINLAVAMPGDLASQQRTMPEAVKGNQLKAWAAAVLEALMGPGSTVTQAELDGLWNRQRELSDVGGENLSKLEQAKKALSGLSRAEALALVSQIFQTTDGTD